VRLGVKAIPSRGFSRKVENDSSGGARSGAQDRHEEHSMIGARDNTKNTPLARCRIGVHTHRPILVHWEESLSV
jgi:hypothetical protein